VGLISWLVYRYNHTTSERGGRDTDGSARSLRVINETVVYCDAQGQHSFDTIKLKDSVIQSSCSQPNADMPRCSGEKLGLQVRSSPTEPDDVVDLPVKLVTLDGRARGCAVADQTVAVITGSELVLIDATTGAKREIEGARGDEVALSDRLVAWSTGQQINFARRHDKQ